MIENQSNVTIRTAISRAIFNVSKGQDSAAVTAYARNRWGATSPVTKGLELPALATGNGLVTSTLERDEFVEAVFSASILGRLNGIVEVPALARVAVDTTGITASFVGEFTPIPAYAGDFSVIMSDKRKVAIIAVITDELLRMTGGAAESVISSQAQRALSRGLDAAFVGSQVRGVVSPAGLTSVAIPAASFAAGLLAFTGDLTKASVLVNPMTAVSLRSPTEQDITAAGGIYGGLPVVTSYAVPLGTLFIVDASRVLAYVGAADIDVTNSASLVLDDGSGTGTTTSTNLFPEGKRALLVQQYADWDFAPGAAVVVALTQ